MHRVTIRKTFLKDTAIMRVGDTFDENMTFVNINHACKWADELNKRADGGKVEYSVIILSAEPCE